VRLEPPGHELDGVDLNGILSGKTTSRGQPVLSTYGRGNHSLRDDRYRYIRYRNGAEEFYDDQDDPYEWKNLANDPKFAAAKAFAGEVSADDRSAGHLRTTPRHHARRVGGRGV
jgi:hypothetical protein